MNTKITTNSQDLTESKVTLSESTHMLNIKDVTKTYNVAFIPTHLCKYNDLNIRIATHMSQTKGDI